MRTFEKPCCSGLGSTSYARGVEIDGVELVTSYEDVKTGDIKTIDLNCAKYGFKDSVRQVLVNKTSNKPTKCKLAKEILAAMKAHRKFGK